MLASYKKLHDALAITQGTNAKIELMCEYKELYPIYDFLGRKPKTHMSEAKLTEFVNNSTSTETTNIQLMDMLKAFENQTVTGNEAKLLVKKFINTAGAEYKKYVIGLASVDPHIGISTAGFAKIVPIQTWTVQLAERWDAKRHEKLMSEHAAFISEKKDGMRLLAEVIPDKKDVIFRSRAGKVIDSLDSLKPLLLRMYSPPRADQISSTDQWVLATSRFIDGEVFSSENSKWSDTVSDIRTLDNKVAAPRFYQFDALTADEFWGKTISPIFSERYKRLLNMETKSFTVDQPAVITLPQYPYMKENFLKLQSAVEANGWEGLIIRCDVPYAGKRSHFLMKWKVFESEEFEVKDVIIEQKFRYPNGSGGYDIAPGVTAVVIEYKGHPTSVGSGFSHDERKKFAQNNGAEIRGKLIEVSYKQETVDSKTRFASLQFPIYKGFIGKKRDF